MSYLLPLGPFHPALRSPQRIVLRAAGDAIVDIEYRDGYTSRSVVERVLRADLARSYTLINRICGVHSHHHALAWTLALESIAGVAVPPRAESLRTIAAELERAISHLQHAAIVFELMGLGQVQQQIVALREWLLAAMQRLAGHRLVIDFVRPGGVSEDIDEDERAAILRLVERPAQALYRFIDRTVRRRGLVRRLVGIGRLTRDAAERLGATGPLGRASGVVQDARMQTPYAAYAAAPPAQVTQTSGDAYGRLMVLLLESYDSLQLVMRLLRSLPGGAWQGDVLESLPPGSSTVTVEAPAGPLRYTLRSDGTRLTDVRIEAPGAPQRLVWRALLAGALVEDAAIIVASAATCAACVEESS